MKRLIIVLILVLFLFGCKTGTISGDKVTDQTYPNRTDITYPNDTDKKITK
jgi:hypothetical protein